MQRTFKCIGVERSADHATATVEFKLQLEPAVPVTTFLKAFSIPWNGRALSDTEVEDHIAWQARRFLDIEYPPLNRWKL